MKNKTNKDLEKLKAYRFKMMNNYQIKVDTYSRLISEINNEQVNRLLISLKKKEEVKGQ